jgi:hypothetical protein
LVGGRCRARRGSRAHVDRAALRAEFESLGPCAQLMSAPCPLASTLTSSPLLQYVILNRLLQIGALLRALIGPLGPCYVFSAPTHSASDRTCGDAVAQQS